MQFTQKPIFFEWERLRALIDQLEEELQNSTYPPPNQRMCRLLIVGEDHRFVNHNGVDVIALCRAIWKTCFCGFRQGGSTIAMQLARTLTGRYERTILRKISEIIVAIQLTKHLPKERLPVLYLWCGYYGWHMNNFREACRMLEIDPDNSSLTEDAELVARLKYPQPKELSVRRKYQIRQRGRHMISLLDSIPSFCKLENLENE